MVREPDPQLCDVSQTMSLIGGRWKAIIIHHLMEQEVLRFGALQRVVGGITQRMLTLQLRELEADGLVTRTVYREVPPRVEYALTPLGRSLSPVIRSMRVWGREYCAQRRTS